MWIMWQNQNIKLLIKYILYIWKKPKLYQKELIGLWTEPLGEELEVPNVRRDAYSVCYVCVCVCLCVCWVCIVSVCCDILPSDGVFFANSS